MSLTHKQRSEYLKEGGVRCPVCKSYNITGTFVETEPGGATESLSCECGAHWVDTYKLTDVSLDEDEPEEETE